MWTQARLNRAKKMPEYREFVEPNAYQSPKEQGARWLFAADVFGFRVKPHKKGSVKIVRFPPRSNQVSG